MKVRKTTTWLGMLGLVAVGALAGCADSSSATRAASESAKAPVELLNVSYDPTRELWTQLNEAFIAKQKAAGQEVTILPSHAGSSSQARAVVEGLPADVVTLAMWTDTNQVAKAGLIDEGWEKELPHDSLPYYSTIVFVVRKGNPKGVKDWADLVKGDTQIVSPNPKTSGNGKLTFLAAWAAVLDRGGSEQDAFAYVKELYTQKRAPVLDSGARGSTTTFAQKGIGDVHLTWENEAHLEVRESQGELEIVYPKASIRAEPIVAVVDANVKRKGTAQVAQAYLEFLYTPDGQEIIAQNYYRPSDEAVLTKFSKHFPPIKLLPVTSVAKDWQDAQTKFFAEGAIFDQIYQLPTN